MSKLLNLSKTRENFFINLPHFFKEISLIFDETTSKNEENQISELSSLFCGQKQAQITMEEYIYRLSSFLKFELSTLISALIYIDRLCELKDLVINRQNIHRVFLVSLVTSIKINEDLHYTNRVFADVGGITLEKLNYLENVFLDNIGFSLYIHKPIYDFYLNNILMKISNRMRNNCIQ